MRKIRDCEVVGLGGAAFRSYKKIEAVKNSRAEKKHFIINAVECDPGLIHDNWLLRQFPEELNQGIKLISSSINFNKIILATKENIKTNLSSEVEIKKVPNFYPIGAEKVLINKILDICFPNNIIPAHKGILVLNIQTIYAIYKAVYLNEKATSKYITIANLKKEEARPVKVELGSRILELMDDIYPGEGPIFEGGGIMQSRRISKGDVIQKTTNFLAVSEIPYYKESPLCSRCGLCIKKCINNLEVYKIADLIDQGEIEETVKYNPEKCISCGACSYHCLAVFKFEK